MAPIIFACGMTRIEWYNCDGLLQVGGMGRAPATATAGAASSCSGTGSGSCEASSPSPPTTRWSNPATCPTTSSSPTSASSESGCSRSFNTDIYLNVLLFLSLKNANYANQLAEGWLFLQKCLQLRRQWKKIVESNQTGRKVIYCRVIVIFIN